MRGENGGPFPPRGGVREAPTKKNGFHNAILTHEDEEPKPFTFGKDSAPHTACMGSVLLVCIYLEYTLDKHKNSIKKRLYRLIKRIK